VLNAIYEEDFLGFSYGFRPGRSRHDALDALAVGIETQRVNWILDADIAGFFDAASHEWLLRFVEHRVGDRRVIRLIRKWLKAGVMENGQVIATTSGTPQGAVISPLLANIYLHYVIDLWAQQWRQRHAQGDMILVRYADDIVVGFQHRHDAERFQTEMAQRLAAFALSLHPDKTRLIEFGRRAADDRRRRGLGKPETFNFLGFTHICARSRAGRFQLRRRSRRDRMRAKLHEIRDVLWQHRHAPLNEQGSWLGSVVRGYFAYHAVPGSSRGTGFVRFGAAVSATKPHGPRSIVCWIAGLQSRPSFTRGRVNASPSNTQGGSRMRECRLYGSVRGARSNARPYRDPRTTLLNREGHSVYGANVAIDR